MSGFSGGPATANRSSDRMTAGRRIGYLALRAGAASSDQEHSALLTGGIQRLFIDVAWDHDRRDQLEAAIAVLDAGDVLVTPALDMLARSVGDLLRINARIDAKGAALTVLEIAGGVTLDTRTQEGRAILGALAVMESLGQAPRLPVNAATQAAPVETLPVLRGRGRPPTALEKSDEVVRLFAQGVRAVDIATRLGIGRASVYRMLQQELPQAQPKGETAGPRRAAELADRLRQAAR